MPKQRPLTVTSRFESTGDAQISLFRLLVDMTLRSADETHNLLRPGAMPIAYITFETALKLGACSRLQQKASRPDETGNRHVSGLLNNLSVRFVLETY